MLGLGFLVERPQPKTNHIKTCFLFAFVLKLILLKLSCFGKFRLFLIYDVLGV